MIIQRLRDFVLISQMQTMDLELILEAQPLTFQAVLSYLDNQSLCNCRLICHSIKNFISDHSFYWKRIIAKLLKNEDSDLCLLWTKCLKQARLEVVKDMALTLKEYHDSQMPWTCKERFWTNRKTPLHFAALSGQLSIFQHVFHQMRLKNPPDRGGITPLHLSAMQGHETICQFQLDNLDLISPKCHFVGDTPLHMAAGYGHLSICQSILSSGIQSSESLRNDLGETPLHCAVNNRQVSVCSFLINTLEDANAEDDTGISPLELARELNYTDIESLFIQ